MTLHLLTRIAVAAIGAVSIGQLVLADLKGDYNIEFVVDGNPYTGKAKFTPGTKGAFTGKYELTTPSNVTSDMTGTMRADSLMFDAKYDDKGRNCTGTMKGRGKAEKDGSKATGAVDITDSCSGAISGTFRVWR